MTRQPRPLLSSIWYHSGQRGRVSLIQRLLRDRPAAGHVADVASVAGRGVVRVIRVAWPTWRAWLGARESASARGRTGIRAARQHDGRHTAARAGIRVVRMVYATVSKRELMAVLPHQ
jgi:hypothetical protein